MLAAQLASPPARKPPGDASWRPIWGESFPRSVWRGCHLGARGWLLTAPWKGQGRDDRGKMPLVPILPGRPVPRFLVLERQGASPIRCSRAASSGVSAGSEIHTSSPTPTDPPRSRAPSCHLLAVIHGVGSSTSLGLHCLACKTGQRFSQGCLMNALLITYVLI